MNSKANGVAFVDRLEEPLTRRIPKRPVPEQIKKMTAYVRKALY